MAQLQAVSLADQVYQRVKQDIFDFVLLPHDRFSENQIAERYQVSRTPVRDALLAFHETHYSANLMSLCVLGREPLDVLAQWVVPLFAAVPNKSLPLPTWPHEPFPPERLGRHFRVLPVKDFSSITLT